MENGRREVVEVDLSKSESPELGVKDRDGIIAEASFCRKLIQGLVLYSDVRLTVSRKKRD